MKTVGLITEYNPFHNGHLYHIEQAKKITGADCVIVIMSGDFVQRGTPAVMDKYLRASAALACGADFVFELPVCYATGSAQYFAEGAVYALDALGIVDSICFGSECGDIGILSEIASVLTEEPDAFKTNLQTALKAGLNYAKARSEAFRLTFPEYADILETPNNILGIEYIKAIKKAHSRIIPYTIKREGHAYHDTDLKHPFASASAIRRLWSDSAILSSAQTLPDTNLLSQSSTRNHRLFIPEPALELYTSKQSISFPICEEDFSAVLYHRLYNSSCRDNSLTDYFEVNTELANRIERLLPHYKGFSDFAMLLKNKAYTYSRICRGLTHILLDIKAEALSAYLNNGRIFYHRLLGMRSNDDNAKLLSAISKGSALPLLTSIKSTPVTEAFSEPAKHMLKTDLAASDLYEHISSIKYARNPIPEATRKFLKY